MKRRLYPGSISYLLTASMFILGTAIALFTHNPVENIMKNYSYDVLVILIAMELFTDLIAETGIMQYLAVKITGFSQGRKRICLIMFGILMFLISSCLNNITAVMMILPVIFVLLKAIEPDRKYVYIFFGVILALSNTGGAASPIGDFPAIVIMTSGITSFTGYLFHAFPLFALTSVILLAVWGIYAKKDADDGSLRRLAVSNLKSQYRNIRIRWDVLSLLALVFIGMIAAWSLVPQTLLPPEVIAILGYAAAMSVCVIKKSSPAKPWI